MRPKLPRLSKVTPDDDTRIGSDRIIEFVGSDRIQSDSTIRMGFKYNNY